MWKSFAVPSGEKQKLLNKAFDAVAAVAISQVVKGDKTDRDKMAAGSTRAPSLTSSN